MSERKRRLGTNATSSSKRHINSKRMDDNDSTSSHQQSMHRSGSMDTAIHLDTPNDSIKRNDSIKADKVDPPVVLDGQAHFTLGTVIPHLTCFLCGRILRHPLTIPECLHSFCKSCLIAHIDNNNNSNNNNNNTRGHVSCPQCPSSLSVKMLPLADPYACVLPDRALEELVDRYLCVEQYQTAQDALERPLYAQQGIVLKSQQPCLANDTDLSNNTRGITVHGGGGGGGRQTTAQNDNRISPTQPFAAPSPRRSQFPMYHRTDKDDEMEFQLRPDDMTSMPALLRPNLKCSKRLPIRSLKKYLLQKLSFLNNNNNNNNNDDDDDDDKSDDSMLLPWRRRSKQIEVLCCGSLVGNELTLAFVDRTVWMDDRQSMLLTYRYSSDGEV